jgi:hypothetical protein
VLLHERIDKIIGTNADKPLSCAQFRRASRSAQYRDSAGNFSQKQPLTEQPSVTPDPPSADLVAAALAASAWVRRRRGVWAGEGAPLPPFEVRVPVSPPAPSTHFPDARPLEATRQPDVLRAQPQPAPPKRAKAAVLGRRSIAFIVEQWKPIVSVALLALVLAGAFVGVRAGWHYLTVTLGSGTVLFDSVPEGSGISVDGIVLGVTPTTRQLRVGHHVVEFRTRQATRLVAIDVSARRENVARLDWTARPMGHLHVESSPAGAHVLVDGSDRGVTPATIDLIVGSHAIVIQNAGGSVQRTVTIANDKTTEVSEGIYAGFLHVSSPIELTISEGTRAYVFDERNQALVPAGPHVLLLQNRDLGYTETRHIEVTPGETFSLAVNPVSTLSITSTVPARAAIDGVEVGDTPITGYRVSLGNRDVAVKANRGPVRRFTVKVTAAPAQLDIDFSKPQ